jgi:hypothetical protein
VYSEKYSVSAGQAYSHISWLVRRHGVGKPIRRSTGCISAGGILSTHHQNRSLNAWHSLRYEGTSSSPIHAF